MSSVSVVMVTYHTGISLWLAMDSVLAQPECSQLILVNNGNIAGVEALLKKRADREPRLKLINSNGNSGFAKACNLGAKSAKGDYILLLNPDCVLPEGGLARALEVMQQYPENTMAGCFLANPSGSEQRGGRRGLLTPANALLETFGLHFLLPREQRLNLNTTRMPEKVHEVPAISGAFMLLPRSYYETLGGMDEDYFLHMEDMDFCYRVQKRGGKIICIPDVKVLHFRSTSEVSSSFVEKQKARSFRLYLRKHFTDEASKVLTVLMILGIEARLVLKTLFRFLDRLFVPPLAARRKIAQLVTLHHITRFEKKEQDLAEKTVLVTGASGQLGVSIVGEALARGGRVIAIYNKTKIDFEHPNLVWVNRNLANEKNPLEGLKANIAIHAADISMLPDMLPALCEGGISRVITFSCTELLEKLMSPEKKCKALARKIDAFEKEILRIGTAKSCNVTIFRVTNMYGIGLDKGITMQADIIRRYGRLPLNFPGSGLRQPVHVRDVAKAAMTVIGIPGTYNTVSAIGGPTSITYREMLERLFTYIGRKPKFIRIPFMPTLLSAIGFIYALKHINGDVARQMNRSISVDNSMPQQDFGYSPRGFLEGEIGF